MALFDPPVREQLWQRAAAVAQSQVRRAVRRRYFPEVWYAIENWCQQLKGRRVLEIGFGIGMVSEALARSGWRVTCTDADDKAIRLLQTRFRHQHLAATFTQTDSTTLPFPNGAFDAVVAINSLELAISPLNTLRELKRVLAPHGRAVVSAFNRHGPWGVPAVLQALHHGRVFHDPLLLTKQEFMFLLASAGLRVGRMKDCACYLPLALPLKMRLPVAGAYLALISGEQGEPVQMPRLAFDEAEASEPTVCSDPLPST